MHDTDFYISSLSQEEDQTPQSIKFANNLRLGTEISDISPKEISTYLKRFCEQIKVLSVRLTGYPTFVLEHPPLETTIRKTVRFERMWGRKEDYWKRTRAHLAVEHTRLANRYAKDTDVVGSRISDRSSQGDLVRTAAVALELHKSSSGSRTPEQADQYTVGMHDVQKRLLAKTYLKDISSRHSSTDSITVDTSAWSRRSPAASIKSFSSRGRASRNAR